jgi:hypothetical protein
VTRASGVHSRTCHVDDPVPVAGPARDPAPVRLRRRPGAPAPEAGVVSGDPGLVRVHGLAVDPVDEQALYVATYTGLFSVDGAEIARVGDATHDLMGFTVAGAGDFLASGHPDLRVEELQVPGKPPLLGLVQSRDARSWASLSLLGEADFHALEAAHGQVYGHDSTNARFMVTGDRRTWETRSQVQLVDFAVSPEDADLLVASAPDGLVRSTDGGRSWTPLDADPLVFLSWDADGLYGVAPDGRVSVSTDAGDTWAARGDVGGEAEALLAAEGRVVAAVRDVGIVESTDGGATFELVVASGAAAGDDHHD